MHDCPRCDSVCGCDDDDEWQAAPLTCSHDCDDWYDDDDDCGEDAGRIMDFRDEDEDDGDGE